VNARSLALITELALAETRGRVTDRGDYLVVETPDDPGYYYGNLLVLPAAPQLGEVAFWSRRFADELGQRPGVRHATFWWDGTSGDVGARDELLAAGFALEQPQVMAATRLAAQEAPLPVRVLSPDEVLATAELAWIVGDRHDEAYRQFLLRRAAWHRELVARGSAHFHGAFDGDALVSSLGLVELGDLARYQDVQTHPSYRGRGLAGALLVAAADATRAGKVVILAEPESLASRVYERIGFRTVERTASACRSPDLA
jgi:GNAT superfamily N-acetyltransferase